MANEEVRNEWDDLARKSLAGDRLAYANLLRSVTLVLTAYFRRSAALSGHAEDLMQDVLISVHTKLHTWRTDAPFAPWLFAIARYRAIDFLRREKRKGLHVDIADENILPPVLPEAESRLAGNDILTALDHLSPRDRELVELCRIRENSPAEVAGTLGISEGAVKTGLHRAVKRLGKILQAAHDGK
jgi:RNA polymerase sigma-70 factor (ECF subfamily)